MGLNIPDLDSKDFDALVEEAVAKLPSLAPEWTDYNLSDPGITVIELLAWFADMDYYRLNRVRDAHLRAFLKIAGVERGDNIPAEVLVSFTSIYDKVQTIPAGTELTGDNLAFLTRSAVRLLPAGIAIASVRVDDLGGSQTVRPYNFYPFGRHLNNGAFFTMTFSAGLSNGLFGASPKELDLHVVASGYAEETIDDGRVAWECCDAAQTWMPVEAIDRTNGLINSGTVTLKLPDAEITAVRCVLKERQHYETPPLIGEVLLNSVVARQEKREDAVLGESSGYVNQRFALSALAARDSLEVKVGAEVWTMVPALRHAKPGDKVYMLEADEIVFGDGAAGKIPDRGATVACGYLCNEGSRGNIKSGAQWQSLDEKISLHNSYGGRGGKERKSIEEAFAAFQSSLNTVHRAVTLADYEILALQTPGTRLARAKAVADKKKNHVTVIVVPQSENSEPTPSALTKQRVDAYLQDRRLLTTTLSVEEPQYIKVHVQTKVHTKLSDPVALKALVIKTLEGFLHPLSGGKNGTGWDFGKSLYLSDLYALVAQVEGVLGIKSLDILTIEIAEGQIKRKKVQKVEIDDDALIASGMIGVEVIGPDNTVCGSSV